MNEPKYKKISKIDAARRQMVTAIKLHFNDEDPISVYTLAQASREIYEFLCKQKELKTFRHYIKTANKDLDDKDLHKIIIGHRDFFKHATRDANTVIEDFSENINDHILLLTVCDCNTLIKKLPLEAQVFQLWYFAVYPEKVEMKEMRELIEPISRLFRGLHNLNRIQQKQKGKKILLEALKDENLLSDPKTDKSD